MSLAKASSRGSTRSSLWATESWAATGSCTGGNRRLSQVPSLPIQSPRLSSYLDSCCVPSQDCHCPTSEFKTKSDDCPSLYPSMFVIAWSEGLRVLGPGGIPSHVRSLSKDSDLLCTAVAAVSWGYACPHGSPQSDTVACYFCTWETEAGGMPRIPGQPELYSQIPSLPKEKRKKAGICQVWCHIPLIRAPENLWQADLRPTWST